MMRRSVEHARAFQHAGWVGKPDRVPIGLDLAGRRPARTGAAVVVLERRWIQEKRLQRHHREVYRTICAVLGETPETLKLRCICWFAANGQLEQFQCRCIVDSGETLRQTGNGEIVWGRSAAQAAAGPRPWGRNTRATGGALLGERAVGMEDLRPA